jgi:carboxypeptidase C (cathepsin A)
MILQMNQLLLIIGMILFIYFYNQFTIIKTNSFQEQYVKENFVENQKSITSDIKESHNIPVTSDIKGSHMIPVSIPLKAEHLANNFTRYDQEIFIKKKPLFKHTKI